MALPPWAFSARWGNAPLRCLAVSGDTLLMCQLTLALWLVRSSCWLAAVMVKAFLAVAAVLAVVAAASASSNPNCDPAYECQYKYTMPDQSASYTFDFSSLCASTDFMLTDQAEHTYYANVCGTAAHNCLPGELRGSISRCRLVL